MVIVAFSKALRSLRPAFPYKVDTAAKAQSEMQRCCFEIVRMGALTLARSCRWIGRIREMTGVLKWSS